MLYVLMFIDVCNDGNHPIAIVDEKGKNKIQKMWNNRDCNRFKNGYWNLIDNAKSDFERRIAEQVYNTFINKGLDYDYVKENRLSFELDSGDELRLEPFNISGEEISEDIFKINYTMQSDKTSF